MEIPDVVLRNIYNQLVLMRAAHTVTAKACAVFGPHVKMTGVPELVPEFLVLLEEIDRGKWTGGGNLFDPRVMK